SAAITIVVIIAFLTMISFPSPLRAQTPTTTDVEVTEWLILLAQPGKSRANSSADISGTLPEALDPLRLCDSATTNQPCPIGVIRFTGHSDAKFSVRLSLP